MKKTDVETKRKRIVLALVLSSYLVVGIDGSLVITAITEIATDLYLTHTTMSWVQNAYVLAFGGFMLAGGRLGDIYGRRLIFCLSLILFGIGSLGGRSCAKCFLHDKRKICAGSRICNHGTCCIRTHRRLF